MRLTTTSTWATVVSKIKGVVDRAAVSKTFTPSGSEQSYTVPKGYHNGSGVVQCKAVSLSGNATAAQVVKGKTFYKDSLTKQTGTLEFTGTAAVANVLKGKTFYATSTSKLTGTMVDRGELTYTFTKPRVYTLPAGYYSGGTIDATEIVSAVSKETYDMTWSTSEDYLWYDNNENADRQNKHNLKIKIDLDSHRIISITYVRRDGGYEDGHHSEWYTCGYDGRVLKMGWPNYISLYKPKGGWGNNPDAHNTYNDQKWATLNGYIYLPADDHGQFNITVYYI